LASCPAVREVRVFGLLIGIELDMGRSFRKWFRKQATLLYILNMFLHRSFPLFIGFCQYEPHVLKLTPPLSITREEIEQTCGTIVEVLKAPAYELLPPALGLLTNRYIKRGRKALDRRLSYESAAR
jgi:4-aminobutyrate aminotransferase-like enzyme